MMHNTIYKLAASANLQDSEAKAIEKIIRDHSLAAAAAGAAISVLPGIGTTIAGIIGKGFTWTMLFRICLAMGVDVNKEALKSFASAVTAKVAAYLAAMLASGMLLSLIPGVGVLGASAMGTLLAFCMVYASGVLFLGLMTRVVNRAEAGDPMTAEQIIAQVEREKITREEIAKAAKEAMDTYAETNQDTTDCAAATA